MAFSPWIPITELSISYPDFQWGAVANPDEIDINNAEIVGKLNNLINKVNTRFSATELPYADGSVITRHYADGSIVDSKISTTANIAQTKINSITGWISTSLSTANSNATLAVNTANSAETKANSAVTTATSAEAKADNAVSTANSAQAKAITADANATTSLESTNALVSDYSTKIDIINAGIASIAEKVDKSYIDGLIADLTIGAMPDGSVDFVKLDLAIQQELLRLATVFNYIHPVSHPASMIEEDAERRFFTDIERAKLQGVAEGANNYVHPSGTNPHGTTKTDVGLGNVDNVKQMPIAGGTFTGSVTAQNNTSYTTKQLRNITLSTSAPSGGANGDVWIQYKP